MVWLRRRRFVCNESVWKTIRMCVSDRSAFLPVIRLLRGLTVPARDTPREVRLESGTGLTGFSRQGEAFLIDALLPPQACSSHPLTTKKTLLWKQQSSTVSALKTMWKPHECWNVWRVWSYPSVAMSLHNVYPCTWRGCNGGYNVCSDTGTKCLTLKVFPTVINYPTRCFFPSLISASLVLNLGSCLPTNQRPCKHFTSHPWSRLGEKVWLLGLIANLVGHPCRQWNSLVPDHFVFLAFSWLVGRFTGRPSLLFFF